MELSKTNKALIVAKEKGYYSDLDGNIFNKNGLVKLSKRDRKKNYKGNISNYYTYTFKVRIPECDYTIRVTAHRFIAYLKFGEKLFNHGIEVRHLNGNSLDNSWNNIEIGTAQQNCLDKPLDKRMAISMHAASFLRVLTNEQVRTLRKDKANGLKHKELMKKFNVSIATISDIVNYKIYKDVI